MNERYFLKSIEQLPPFLQVHSKNVACYMRALAESVGGVDIEKAYQAGLYHDIGKRGIPSSIWNKAGGLTKFEWEKVKMHPILGGTWLSEQKADIEIIQCAKYHHEKLDGSVYPYGLKGEDIPIIARICSIADSFDAMIAARPYSKPKTTEEAISDLYKYAGIQFDSDLVESFTTLLLKSENNLWENILIA